MQNVIVILILSFISFESFAQMHISTNMRRDAVFNEITREYDLISEDKEELTFFEFNKDFTMFKHTTPNITSSYIIKSSTRNKENETWDFEIMSDVGNRYYMILDKKKNNIRFIYTRDNSTLLTQHTIKSLWFDKEKNTDYCNSELTEPSNLKLPLACDLLSPEYIKNILNINTDISVKDASIEEPSMTQSCFFKWDDENTEHAGLLVQVLKNPVYNKYPEYILDFVKLKLEDGEISKEDENNIIEYSPFSFNGGVGAYSFQKAYFYWTCGGNYQFMLAFNISTLTEEKMVALAIRIITEINGNFISNIK